MEAASEPNNMALASTLLENELFALADRVGMIHDFLFPTKQSIFRAETGPIPIGRMGMWRLGGLLVVDGALEAFDLVACTRQIEWDELKHWVLRVMRKGRMVSRSGDCVYRQASGEVVLESLRTASDCGWSEADGITFVIPREGFECLGDAHHGPLQGASVRLFGDFALSLVDRLREATVADIAVLTQATQGMIRSCLKVDTPGAICRDVIMQRYRERVRAVIRRNLASPRLTPARICELTRLSRSALYRLFEEHGGVGHYIQLQRLHQVLQDLRDPAHAKTSISELAERSGFYNASAFSRVFRRHFGYTPSEARHAAICRVRLAAAEPDGTGQFERLLG